MSKYLIDDKLLEYVKNYELGEVSNKMNWRAELICQMKNRQAKKIITSDGQKIVIHSLKLLF